MKIFIFFLWFLICYAFKTANAASSDDEDNVVDFKNNGLLPDLKETDECPSTNGYYRVGDNKNCGRFRICQSGTGFNIDCGEGLAFNKNEMVCQWPDEVEDCDSEAYLGFKCPKKPKPRAPYTLYANPNNCQQYFTCMENGPRLMLCPENEAFNETESQYDDIKNVCNCNV